MNSKQEAKERLCRLYTRDHPALANWLSAILIMALSFMTLCAATYTFWYYWVGLKVPLFKAFLGKVALNGLWSRPLTPTQQRTSTAHSNPAWLNGIRSLDCTGRQSYSPTPFHEYINNGSFLQENPWRATRLAVHKGTFNLSCDDSG